MDRFEIEERIYEASRVISTWPNPLAVLRCKSSQPEVVRNEDDDWLRYNTEAAQANLNVKFTPDSRQHQQAMEVLDWLSYAVRNFKPANKPAIKSIIMLYCMNMNNSSYGFRELSRQLKVMGVKMGKDTVRRRYNEAMLDLEYALARKELIRRYINGK